MRRFIPAGLLAIALPLALGPLAAAAQGAPPAPIAAPAPAASAPALKIHELRAADGIPLNVVESGNPRGTAIVFLHGAYQSYLSWLAQLRDPGLAKDFRLIALDMRGHGGSGKPWDPYAYLGSKPWADDVRAVVTQLGLEKPLLVGWSFGGYVVMDYVREYGADAIAGGILVGSHGGLLARLPGGGGNRAAAPDGNLEVLRQGARDFAAVMSAKPLPAEAVDRIESAYLMMPAYARRGMRGKRLDNTDLAGKVATPLLFIFGSQDAIMVGAELPAVVGALPAGRLTIYDGVGHSPFAEATPRFNADLRCFAATRAACP
jgi:pimeloyl-ACP methyl ester carboxylesterase